LIFPPRQTKYGSEPSLNIVRGSKSRNVYLDWQGALIRVDLPAIPEELIDSVTLNLYHNNPYREEIAVHRMLKGWKEKEVTHDRPSTSAPLWADGWVPGSNYAMEPTAEVSISQTGRWYTIDVTADVKAFLSGTAPNHGWFLMSGETIGDDGDPTVFVSKEGRVGQRPYLKIQTNNTIYESNIPDKSTQFAQRIVQWVGIPTHGAIIKDALIKMRLMDTRLGRIDEELIYNAADDPDYWAEEEFIKLKIKDYLVWNNIIATISEICHSIAHYYNPSLFSGFGLAPYGSQANAEMARGYYHAGDYEKAGAHIAYSSHYLTDTGNPMHTGMEVEQAWDKKVEGWDTHGKYEEYVGLKWDNPPYQFNQTITRDLNWYEITNPERTTKNLARYSNAYLNPIYIKMKSNKENFDLDPMIARMTDRCLIASARNTRGLVWYLRS
jgi:hypothetical protein